MGRPCKSSILGPRTGSGNQLQVTSCWVPGDGGAITTAYIVKQYGQSTFIARNPATGNQGPVKLQAGSVTAAGQARIEVYPFGSGGSGATGTAVIGLTSFGAINTIGSGYAAAEVITLAQAGSTSTQTAQVTVSHTQLVTLLINAAGSNYAPGGVLTLVNVGGTMPTGPTVTITNTKLVSAPTIATAGTAGGYVPGTTLTLAGGTFSAAATLNLTHTKVVAATVAAGGTGGSAGTQTVTGTTGTGTKFQASVTVSGGGAITAVLSISVAGDYTVNPTLLTAEPVTGASLTGATLNIKMGPLTVTVATGGTYTVNGTALTDGTADATYTATNSNYGINAFSITTKGDFTANATSFTVASGGATFQTPSYGVKAVTVSRAGNYTVTDANNLTQSSSSASGTGLVLSTPFFGLASITAGVTGSGYTGAIVEITGGGGTDAAATTNLTVDAVTSYTVTNAGSTTYTSVPTVTVVSAGTTEYLKKLEWASIITTAGHRYRWTPANTATHAGQAVLPMD